MTLFVSNLPNTVTQEALESLFAQYGTVRQVRLLLDKDTSIPSGVAFIHMDSESEELKAIAELDGAQWSGQDLKVNQARSGPGN